MKRKADFADGFAIGFVIGIILAVVLMTIQISNVKTDSYCKALGGTAIATNTCNVNGKVVTF